MAAISGNNGFNFGVAGTKYGLQIIVIASTTYVSDLTKRMTSEMALIRNMAISPGTGWTMPSS